MTKPAEDELEPIPAHEAGISAQVDTCQPPAEPPRDVGRAAREGGAWSVITYAFSKVSGFASSVVLARLLMPEAFGLISMSNTILGMVQMLGNCGIGFALMHQRDDIEDYANTTWWLDVIFGAVLMVLAMVFAPVAAAFYHKPELTLLIRVSSINFIISPIGGTMGLLLTRDLLFKLNAKIALAQGVIASVLTIIFAACGAGVWSFVYPPIIANIAYVIMRWWLCPWRPKLKVKWGLARKLISFGWNILGASLFDYLNTNADYIMVGMLMGDLRLGLYTWAYMQGTWIVQNISQTIAGVLFPTFASIQNERDRAKSMFLKLIGMVAMVGFPIVCLEWAVAPLFIGSIYSAKWLPAVTAFRLIALYGMGRAVCAPGGTLISALGRPDINFKISAALCPVLVGAIYIGSHYGINGVALATAVAHGLFVWLYVLIPFRILGWNPMEAARALAPAFVTSVVAAVATGTVYRACGGGTNSLPMLFALICLGVATYAAANWFLFPSTSRESLRILRTTLQEARGAA